MHEEVQNWWTRRHLETKSLATLVSTIARNSGRSLKNRVEVQNGCLALGPRGGGVIPSKRLLGMCRWMGSHFHNWTDYNGVTFLVELLEWARKFSGFLG